MKGKTEFDELAFGKLHCMQISLMRGKTRYLLRNFQTHIAAHVCKQNGISVRRGDLIKSAFNFLLFKNKKERVK